MAPKVAAAKSAASKKATPPQHPPYKEMIKEAILSLKDRNGSSRPALKKYIKANYQGVETDRFDGLFNQAIKRGGDAKEFSFPKGPSGTVKLAKKEPVAKAVPAKKPAAKTGAKPAAKKPATKKATAKPKASDKEKTTPKKAASKPKANAKKPRKESSAAAPAVVEKTPVLTKTKSGRVSKGTTASKPAKAVKKASPPKKKAASKKTEEAA